MASYGNWLQINDDISNQFVWVPSSGFAAAVYASTSQFAFPWAAPAGLNRGTLYNVTDLGITSNQKQSDLLYKINVNPINFFGNDGYAIFGQKTLYRKPSAFDRVNVRRLFLTLEKETKQLLKYYVFEPNTFTTRQRLIGSLQPTFDRAKVNDGLYEYQIICDERNNTPDVIDNNELKISIYIKPVRTAEFILADFIGTRTGVSFSELIG
jgi:phage tail sheath protein FI